MSGSNPPSGPRNGGGHGDDFDCLKLVERTSLSSPAPEIVSKLKDGDQLEVVIGREGGADVLQALDSNGTPAGSLVPLSFPRFIMCIRQGVKYVAVIRAIDGGRISVEIRPGAQ